MKVLVTGGAGYIGSMLIPALLNAGYSVRCLDRLFFGRESLNQVISNPSFELVKDDVRWFDPSILRDVDAVVDLAALSNDPSGELDPSKTLDINYLGRVRVAKLSKEYGVKRYIVASSCSVYGFQEGILNETSTVNPLTTYAKANIMAERDTLPLSDAKFASTALRFATVYGLSARMRFDLAINGIVLGLHKTGKIPVMRDGTQWRPFIHVRDVANAFIAVIQAPAEKVGGQVFNVGSEQQNYQIHPLAELIGKSIGAPFQIEWYGSPDNRSYRVSFDKIKSTLQFTPRCTIGEGAVEVYNALKEGGVSDTLKTKTVDWYKHLLEAHALSSEVALRGSVL
jgi:nucleoside-diphosphate-sugar epimerase